MSYSYQKGFSWPLALFGLVVTIILVGMIVPLFTFSRSGGPLTEAHNNAKAIAGALNIFRQEYGRYPCDFTRKILEEKGHDNLPSGTSANAYLAQLVATGIIDSETYFFAPGMEGIRRGDDEKASGRLLEKGENGFAYIMAEGGESLGGDISITPLVIAPIRRSDGPPVFDPEAYGDRYVYGAVDGSSKQGEIQEDGTAARKGHAHLFEGGPDSLFGDETPVIKYPLGF